MDKSKFDENQILAAGKITHQNFLATNKVIPLDVINMCTKCGQDPLSRT